MSSLIRHVVRCNSVNKSAYVPFLVDGQAVGWVRKKLAGRLARMRETVRMAGASLALAPRLDSADARSKAMSRVVEVLVSEGWLKKAYHEMYPVVMNWGGPVLMRVDRAACMHFGLKAFAVFANGFVRDRAGLKMWVARRAANMDLAPGQLDNLVGGGQPAGISLRDNLVKEAKEECGMPPRLVRNAVPVGAISYAMDDGPGLRRDTIFIYDIALPRSFRPSNRDGEVQDFMLWPLARVVKSVESTDEWKFNCNLVLIDFFIRHGAITPEHAEYLALIHGLHR